MTNVGPEASSLGRNASVAPGGLLASVGKSGYNFSLAGTSLAGAPATCNGLGAGLAAPGYAIVADQIDAPPTGGKFYGSNADGVIYQHTASLALLMPESGGPLSGSPIH